METEKIENIKEDENIESDSDDDKIVENPKKKQPKNKRKWVAITLTLKSRCGIDGSLRRNSAAATRRESV
jgi:hypothetical protein